MNLVSIDRQIVRAMFDTLEKAGFKVVRADDGASGIVEVLSEDEAMKFYDITGSVTFAFLNAENETGSVFLIPSNGIDVVSDWRSYHGGKFNGIMNGFLDQIDQLEDEMERNRG